jgi:hypothetical protein
MIRDKILRDFIPVLIDDNKSWFIFVFVSAIIVSAGLAIDHCLQTWGWLTVRHHIILYCIVHHIISHDIRSIYTPLVPSLQHQQSIDHKALSRRFRFPRSLYETISLVMDLWVKFKGKKKQKRRDRRGRREGRGKLRFMERYVLLDLSKTHF